jgi:antitoxin component YwqK of YwqJK toxin-antitoxin module
MSFFSNRFHKYFKKIFNAIAKFVLIGAGLLTAACKQYSDTNQVLYSDPGLSLADGILLYDGTPYSGTVYGLYSSQDSMFAESYQGGLRHGVFYQWYPSGNLMETGTYEHGYLSGQRKGYWENGQNNFLYTYENQQLHGNAEEWYPNKIRKLSMFYKEGKEEGLQTFWTIDGRPHMSYEVSNGVIRYLPGPLNCYIP